MLKKHKLGILVLLIFTCLSIVIFRKYFFQGYVPLPSNLQVSFYSPWKYVSWEGYPNGPANKPIGFDVLKLFYPYRSYTNERLMAGELPLWNPYVFSGNIHLATYQSAVFYPLNAVYFFLPMIDAWAILVVVQPILAGYFTYLFVRSLGLSFRASLFSSIVFALSGWMIAWMEESIVIEHSALWLPLVLYGIQTMYGKHIIKGFLLAVVGLTCSILAGFLQMTLYLGLFSFVYVIYNYYKSSKRDTRVLIYFFTACLVSFGISAIHLIPSLVSYFYSPRGVVAAPFLFDIYLMKPWHLLTFLAPDFWGNPGTYTYFGGAGFYHEKTIFIGVPALFLGLYMVFCQEKASAKNDFFKLSAIFTIALGFFPIGWLLYYSRLPIISAMVPSRIFFLSTFSFAVLSGYGMDKLLKAQWDTKLMRKIVVAVVLLLGMMWLLVLVLKFIPFLSFLDPKDYYANTAFKNLIIPSAIIIVCGVLFWMFPKLKRRVALYFLVLLVINIISSLYFAHKFLYFSERKFVFPDVPVLTKVKELAGINRVWGYGNGYIEKNMTSFYRIYSPEGYDALFSQYYGELMYIQETEGKYTNQISRTDAHIRPIGEKDKISDDPIKMRLLSILGVRYIVESKQGEDKDVLSTEERFPQDKFNLSWEDENFRIWEFKEALPRAFLAHDYLVEENPQKSIPILFDPSFNPQKKLILTQDPNLESCISDAESKATIEEYLPERIKISTNSDCEAMLFLSDSYYPGWTATVDSKEAPIIRTFHSLRSVAVPKGEHLVEFTYKPDEIRWGIAITSLSIILLFPIVFILKRHN